MDGNADWRLHRCGADDADFKQYTQWAGAGRIWKEKRSVNTSRAVLKGKMAEQLAPILPEFQYLPSDAKFLGDPVDYIVFDGYTDYRDGDGLAEDIEVVLIDIKSGGARLTKGQQAIAQAIAAGNIRFETIRINFDD